MGKYCLEDNDFAINIRETFRRLKESKTLFDVTLVTDDGQHLQAHKIVLTAGSHFFNDIFMKSNHANMLVYLKGISSKDLKHITDFLYTGVTSIPQEDLNIFLEIAKELKVKGLQAERQDTVSKAPCEQKDDKKDINFKEESRNKIHSNDLTVSLDHSDHPSAPEENANEDNVVFMKTEVIELQVSTDEDVAKRIDQITGKVDGGWNCTVCGRISTKKQNMRMHAESHLEGMSYKCHICSKSFNVKRYLNQHVSNIHCESLFSCEICGKSEMNKSQQYKHKCQKQL